MEDGDGVGFVVVVVVDEELHPTRIAQHKQAKTNDFIEVLRFGS